MINMRGVFIWIFVFWGTFSCYYYLGQVGETGNLLKIWKTIKTGSENLFDSSPAECPPLPPGLQGRSRVNLTDLTWEEVETGLSRTEVQAGGQFSPTCHTKHRGRHQHASSRSQSFAVIRCYNLLYVISFAVITCYNMLLYVISFSVI